MASPPPVWVSGVQSPLALTEPPAPAIISAPCPPHVNKDPFSTTFLRVLRILHHDFW
ncbi:hypothetical protein BofuT4_uP035300.1 [Botrytis cinerea T4]|uniref:Uncharacterized protein n=1 Tax=Botryotinia fuckeliana (strain T4) TaxID=999810 RepID=G2Y6I5_BOTF4|nr:hypothetical protein BofuT4_uP035300.1 [Botrytis cinerea T4]